MKRKKEHRKAQYPQWPHPAGIYGERIQTDLGSPIRRVIKRVLQWVALFALLLIFVTVFGLALRFCDEVLCVFVR